MRLFVATALALLAFAAVPNAAATDLGAVDADLALLDCYSSGRDLDGDGSVEPWTICSTPTCGCNCPYVGAGVVVQAADQQVGAFAITSGCQTAYGTGGDDGEQGELPVTPFVFVGGGGLGDIEPAIDTSVTLP